MPCVARLCACIPCFANEYTLLCKEYALLYKEYARDHPGVTVLEESFFDDVIRFASQLCLAHSAHMLLYFFQGAMLFLSALSTS